MKHSIPNTPNLPEHYHILKRTIEQLQKSADILTEDPHTIPWHAWAQISQELTAILESINQARYETNPYYNIPKETTFQNPANGLPLGTIQND